MFDLLLKDVQSKWKFVEAESGILKQSSKQSERQFLEPLRCLKICGNVCRRRDVHRCEQRSVYCFHQYYYTAISINVVGSKLQAYATRPNGSVGRSRRLPHVLNTNEV